MIASLAKCAIRKNMSIYGECYDNGQSGLCGEDCELFREKKCPEEQNILEELPVERKLDLILENIDN